MRAPQLRLVGQVVDEVEQTVRVGEVFNLTAQVEPVVRLEVRLERPPVFIQGRYEAGDSPMSVP